MPQSLSNLIMHLKPYWLDVASAVAGIEINKIIYLPISGAATFYTKTAANLTTALAGMNAGEIVQINGPCTLAGNFTIPAGGMLRAMSRYEVELTGTINTGDGSSLFNILINATANDANTLYGVTGPSTGIAYLINSDIYAVQSGAGNAYAIGAVNGLGLGDGDIYAENCYLYGESTGGNGYAGRSTGGQIYAKWCDMYGSTDRFALI